MSNISVHMGSTKAILLFYIYTWHYVNDIIADSKTNLLVFNLIHSCHTFI